MAADSVRWREGENMERWVQHMERWVLKMVSVPCRDLQKHANS